MAKHFKIGTEVQLTADAQENYPVIGDRVMRITHVATKYMPTAHFFASGSPQGYHPGYDDATKDALYDLVFVDDDTPVNCSLYTWELTVV